MRPHDPHNRRRLREQPINRLFPNMITLAGLCCGLSAVRFAMVDRWEFSVGFILAAALIDGMDGRVARMLGATSTFGAQLDSLSDFLCFGVAPALVMYMWLLGDIKGIGWAVTLFFVVCTALRLARFNTALIDEHKEPWEKQFFTGVPSPAGGMLCLLPLIIALQTDGEFQPHPAIIAAYVALIGALMFSRIPTYSGKQMRIKHEMVPLFMIAGTAALVFFIIEPWMFMAVSSFVYIGSIVFAICKYKKLKRQTALERGENEAPL